MRLPRHETYLRLPIIGEVLRKLATQHLVAISPQPPQHPRIEALDGVEAAEVSHEAGTAVVSMGTAVDDAVLKDAVEAKDYKVLGIE